MPQVMEVPNVTPSELTILLAEAIKARTPVLITGAPGVGKSSVTYQSVVRAQASMLLSHPGLEDPTDAKGLPWIGKDGLSAQFLPFGNLAKAMAATDLTAWILEDMGQAQAATQASYMQLLLAREANGHKLPDCVTFIACTNRRIDKAGVSGILEPVKSRFLWILNLVPDLNDFCSWAFDNGLPPILIAWLRFRPDRLCDFQPSADMTNSPVPRTWANVGKILQMDLPDALMSKAIAGAVGVADATMFDAFRRLHKSLPSIDAVLMDPDNAPIPDKTGTLYAVVTALGMRANVATFGRIAKYAARLNGDQKGDFAALLLRDCIRRDPEIQNTTDFNRLVSGDLGQLMGGI